MRLPQLIYTKKDIFIYFFYGVVLTLTLYQVTNRIHFSPPHYLALNWIDQAMPLIPWTIWVYFTEYVVFIVSWWGLASNLDRTKYFYAYTAILIISSIIFVIWPTTFPRENFPLDSFTENFNTNIFHFFRKYMDTPANCVPSLHVSSCYIAALVFWESSKRKFLFFTVWATLVSVSTLTTKQHYFVDIWTAMILTIFCYIIFFRFVEYAE